jgi:hypothetical protein
VVSYIWQGMLRDIERKRQELLGSTATHGAREASLLEEMRTLKASVERELSTEFKGRPVHIVGNINTLIRAA